MRKNYTEMAIFCLAASFFCISAQAVETEESYSLEQVEESKELSLGGCRDSSGKKEDCKMKDQSCKKNKEPGRKSAASRVLDGS